MGDDGEWEPSLIDNPEFQGEWHAKKIDNPDYKGEWKPAQITNPDFEEGVQLAAYDSAYVGEKLWRPTSKGEKEVKEEWDKVNKPADDLPSDDEDVDEDEAEDEEPEKDEL